MLIGKRIKEFLDFRMISGPEFYKEIGIGRVEFSSWINGNKAISVLKIGNILRSYPELNARWFITGEGDMVEGLVKEITICNDCKNKDTIIEMQADHINTLKTLFESLKIK